MREIRKMFLISANAQRSNSHSYQQFFFIFLSFPWKLLSFILVYMLLSFLPIIYIHTHMLTYNFICALPFPLFLPLCALFSCLILKSYTRIALNYNWIFFTSFFWNQFFFLLAAKPLIPALSWIAVCTFGAVKIHIRKIS